LDYHQNLTATSVASLHFNGYFPGRPGLSGSRMSILDFIGDKGD